MGYDVYFASGGQWVSYRDGHVVTPPGQHVILDQNFDSFANESPVTLAHMRSALGDSSSAVGGSTTWAGFDIIDDGSGGHALRWNSPHDTYSGISPNGVTTFPTNPLATAAATYGPIMHAWIQYAITFPLNMDWSKGGKLPGLGGSITGNPPTGGAGPTDNGWSGRFMWLGPTAGSWAGRRPLTPNEWIGYLYWPNQIDQYGDNIWTSCSFIAGQRHVIRAEYQMNTVTAGVGNPDGQLIMTFDGVQVVNNTTAMYRNNEAVAINCHLFHLFRGGADITWAGSVDNQIIVDDLQIGVYT